MTKKERAEAQEKIRLRVLTAGSEIEVMFRHPASANSLPTTLKLEVIIAGLEQLHAEARAIETQYEAANG